MKKDLKHKTYKLNKGFIIQKMDNNITKPALFIFPTLKLSWDKEKITTAIVDRYDITEEKAQEDLNALVNDLLKYKVITQKTE